MFIYVVIGKLKGAWQHVRYMFIIFHTYIATKRNYCWSDVAFMWTKNKKYVSMCMPLYELWKYLSSSNEPNIGTDKLRQPSGHSIWIYVAYTNISIPKIDQHTVEYCIIQLVLCEIDSGNILWWSYILNVSDLCLTALLENLLISHYVRSNESLGNNKRWNIWRELGYFELLNETLIHKTQFKQTVFNEIEEFLSMYLQLIQEKLFSWDNDVKYYL